MAMRARASKTRSGPESRHGGPASIEAGPRSRSLTPHMLHVGLKKSYAVGVPAPFIVRRNISPSGLGVPLTLPFLEACGYSGCSRRRMMSMNSVPGVTRAVWKPRRVAASRFSCPSSKKSVSCGTICMVAMA